MLFTVCVMATKTQTTWHNHNCPCRCIHVKRGFLWLLEQSWIGNLLPSLPHSGCWIIVIESSCRFIFADRGRLKPSPLSRRSLCEVAGVETCTAFVLRYYSPAVLYCCINGVTVAGFNHCSGGNPAFVFCAALETNSCQFPQWNIIFHNRMSLFFLFFFFVQLSYITSFRKCVVSPISLVVVVVFKYPCVCLGLYFLFIIYLWCVNWRLWEGTDVNVRLIDWFSL